MLTWDRFHNNNDDDWFIRPDGFAFVSTPGAFCLLLNADPGTDDKTLQLNADPGTDDHCLELNTSTL